VAVVVAVAALTLAHVASFLTCMESLTMLAARLVGVSRPVALRYSPSLRAAGATPRVIRDFPGRSVRPESEDPPSRCGLTMSMQIV
jgi:hypothetical protein